MRHNRFVSEGEKETFIKTLGELKSGAVIVEGKKDVRALESLGLTDIIPLNNTPLAEFVQRIIDSNIHEVIILTDFDKEGRKLEKKLDVLLRSHKVRVNRRLRRILMGFGKGRIEDFKNTKLE
jgi:5S rRNA maturation endonuclease (ribonuclease M5)